MRTVSRGEIGELGARCGTELLHARGRSQRCLCVGCLKVELQVARVTAVEACSRTFHVGEQQLEARHFAPLTPFA